MDRSLKFKAKHLELFSAIRNNDRLKLALMLHEGFDINESYGSNEDKILLHFAARHGDGETFSFLIENGANVHHTDFQGYSLLHYMVVMPEFSKEKMELLIGAGTDINRINRQGDSPLRLALGMQKDLEVLKWLVDHGADPNFDGYENTLLMSMLYPNGKHEEDFEIER